jgi:hypothetical protein
MVPEEGTETGLYRIVNSLISEQRGILTLIFLFFFLSGWVEQISWATCFERESKKAGPGYFDYKVCIVVLSRIFIFYANI